MDRDHSRGARLTLRARATTVFVQEELIISTSDTGRERDDVRDQKHGWHVLEV
jgi:hypothetical protein